MAFEQPPQLRLVAGQVADQIVKRFFRPVAPDGLAGGGKGRLIGGPVQHPVAGLPHQVAGLTVIHHLKMRRDGCFQRKPPQHGLAESVNGLDFQAARRVENLGEQDPRTACLIQRRRHAEKFLQGRRQRLVAQGGPLAKRLVDAVRHLGGGRLGEGDAQDGFRTRPVE